MTLKAKLKDDQLEPPFETDVLLDKRTGNGEQMVAKVGEKLSAEYGRGFEDKKPAKDDSILRSSS